MSGGAVEFKIGAVGTDGEGEMFPSPGTDGHSFGVVVAGGGEESQCEKNFHIEFLVCSS